MKQYIIAKMKMKNKFDVNSVSKTLPVSERYFAPGWIKY